MLIKNEYKPRMASRQRKEIQPISNNARINLVFGAVVAAFTVLVGFHFLYMNINEKELGDASKRTLGALIEPEVRGNIVDRHGRILATSRPLKMVTFNPQQIYTRKKDNSIDWNAISDEKFAKLSLLLKMPEHEVRARLQNTGSKRERFKTKLTLEEMDAIKALRIPSASFENTSERSYPYGRLFSHVVGFTNTDGGVEGIELRQNKRLLGTKGVQMISHDSRSNIVEIVDSARNVEAEPGETIRLSLDYQIQKLAHDELQRTLREFNAHSGSVVVLDAKNGEILAMSSLPDYDANYYQQAGEDAKLNLAVSNTIDPGSIMKPFIVAKGIDSGRIHRHSVFDTRPYMVLDKMIKDTHVYPSLSSEGILQKSSNVGTSKIAAMFSNEELRAYFVDFGLGKRTQAGVPGEQFAAIPKAEKWTKLDKAVMSYGYSISATLLQMAQGYTIFTADGKLMPATVFKRDKAVEGRQVLKPETARIMREMMVSVTQKGGTGQAGAVAGFDVAGKTGTARKHFSGEGGKKGGYHEDKHIASFVGFAPAQNPRLIVAVSIDEPRGKGYYGGTVAGPIFSRVMGGSLKILDVKPTRTADQS